MLTKDAVLAAVSAQGKVDAAALQKKAASLTGTELNGQGEVIPTFAAALKKKNMSKRKAGFVCRSPAGRVVKLIQPYDSDTYPQEPEELPAQWGFAWSTDPAHALPFVAIATSPYNTGDCCTHEGKVWRSGQDGNVWAPGTTGVKWEEVTA